MWALASVFGKLFDVLLAPFRGMHPAVGLAVISVITGVIMLVIFGKASNQKAIKRAKGLLKAYIAEIWLFRDDLLQMVLAVVRVVANTGRYFAHSLRPLIFILIPVLIIMVMLGVRYEHRPFQPGEEAVLAVQLDDPTWARGDVVELTGSTGVEVISPALRIPQQAEIDWQIRITEPGEHTLTLRTPGGEESKQILASLEAGPLTSIAAARGRTFSEAFLLFPAEPPVSVESGIRKIDIRGWPTRELKVFGLGAHWLIFFFVVSLVAGFAVKGLFGVEV